MVESSRIDGDKGVILWMWQPSPQYVSNSLPLLFYCNRQNYRNKATRALSLLDMTRDTEKFICIFISYMFLIAKTLHGGNYLNIYDLVDRCASILLSSD